MNYKLEILSCNFLYTVTILYQKIYKECESEVCIGHILRQKK